MDIKRLSMIVKWLILALLKSLASLFFLIMVYFSTAFILSRITVQEEIQSKKEVSVFILTNGVHTDLVLPIRTKVIDWSESVSFSDTKSKDSVFNYIGFGWGDKGFYLETPEWEDLSFNVAFKAATGLSTSAMHTTFHESLKVGENCRKISMSFDNYSRLVNFISESFEQNSQGKFVKIETEAVYGKNDAFYEAVGRYHVFHTCNTWANNALKISGQRACLWTVFDTGVFLKYPL